MSQVNEGESEFEQLTSMAMEAATQGKWDSVAQLYDRRALCSVLLIPSLGMWPRSSCSTINGS